MRDKGMIRAFLLVVGFLALWGAVGCGDGSDGSPKRFQCIERVSQGNFLYEDTTTGDVWMYSAKGCMASDTWTKVEQPK